MDYTNNLLALLKTFLIGIAIVASLVISVMGYRYNEKKNKKENESPNN